MCLITPLYNRIQLIHRDNLQISYGYFFHHECVSVHVYSRDHVHDCARFCDRDVTRSQNDDRAYHHYEKNKFNDDRENGHFPNQFFVHDRGHFNGCPCDYRYDHHHGCDHDRGRGYENHV